MIVTASIVLVVDLITKVIATAGGDAVLNQEPASLGAVFISGVAICAFVVIMILAESGLGQIATGLLIGGSLGNSFFFFGRVPDFIPVVDKICNVADLALFLGGALLILAVLDLGLRLVLAPRTTR